MKKLSLIILFITAQVSAFTQITPVLKVNDGNTGGNNGKCVQIGSENTSSNLWYLSLGKGTGSSNWGAWAIEHWNDGLNFWKPYPTSNSGNFKLHIHDEGFVGINGKANPNATFNTKGNFRLQVFGNTLTDRLEQFSDSILKENVVSIGTAIPKLMQMTPIEYNYKAKRLSGINVECLDKLEIANDTLPHFDNKRRYGFTAQQVKRVFPLLEETYNESLGVVDYIGFIPLLVRGVQEHQNTIDTLRNQIDSLNLQIQNLRQEIINWQGRSIDTIGQSRSRLFQNTPNPFDGNTTITYFIDENTAVTSASIEVRNIMGALQSTIVLNDGTGLGSVVYNGSNLTAGYFIYTLKINGSVKDSKMFLKEF
jgi:hypothetical protein